MQRFTSHLVNKGVITQAQATAALDVHKQLWLPIGRIAIREGKLTEEQISAILERQAQSHMPFGEIAIFLGFLTPHDVTHLLELQLNIRPIEQIFVELGYITQARLESERAQFQAGAGT